MDAAGSERARGLYGDLQPARGAASAANGPPTAAWTPPYDAGQVWQGFASGDDLSNRPDRPKRRRRRWILAGIAAAFVFVALVVAVVVGPGVVRAPEIDPIRPAHAEIAPTTTTIDPANSAAPDFETGQYGFVLAVPQARLKPTYAVHVVDSEHNDAVLGAVDVAINQISSEMSTVELFFDRLPYSTPASDGPVAGHIEIVVEDLTDECGAAQRIVERRLGCTLTTSTTSGFTGVVEIEGSVIRLSAELFSGDFFRSDDLLEAIVIHELSHAFNLGHFEEEVNGRPQIMRAVTEGDYSTLGDGDRNGLRYMGNLVAGPIEVDSKASPPFRTVCEIQGFC